MGFPFADKLVPPSPCCSQEQTPPIYCGPGAGKGFSYDTFEGYNSDPPQTLIKREKAKNCFFEHIVFFKGDSFTVREDMRLTILEEEKHTRPQSDHRIRNVWDPANKEFLESLKNEQCPTELSKGFKGLHFIHLYGLHDDQDLKEPAIPDDCVEYGRFDDWCM